MTVTADYPGLYVPDDPFTTYKLLGSRYWLTRDDGVHTLRMVAVDDMTPSHRAHLLDWLRRNAARMVDHVARSLDQAYWRNEITWEDRAARLADLTAQPPAVWIEDTALVRRLVALVPREPELPRRGLLDRIRRTR